MTVHIPSVVLNSGQSIPLLGLGTSPMNDAESATAVTTAIGLGYRLIDTAARYRNETGVGNGIRDSGVARSELFVTTKLPGADHGYLATRESLGRSLDRLGLDYVDLYLIHWPLPRIDKYVESFEAMIELAGEGLVRAIGVSNFLPEHVQRLIDTTGITPAVDQIQLSPALARTSLRTFLGSVGVVTQAWSPMGRAEGVPTEPSVTALAAKYGRSSGQIILRWIVQQGIVAIPKSASAQRQHENASVFDFELAPEDMASLSALDRGESAARDSNTHEEF